MLNLLASTLVCPKQVLHKNDGLSYISQLPAKKIAIIATERSSSNYKHIGKIINDKKRLDAKLIIPEWKNEPSLKEIIKTLPKLHQFKPDWIVAIGGGSVIDGAKIAWALYEHPNFDTTRLSIPFSLPNMRIKAKFVAIPTTAGTGSETSSSAILTDGNTKVPVVTHDFIPDLAILDPTLLKDIPIKVLVPSMLDALSHSLEGFVSKVENTIVNNLACHAINNMNIAFNKLTNSSSYQDNALIGAFFSGIVQNVNVVGPAHALAHNIGTLPHGLATGLFLPEVIRTNCKKNPDMKKNYNLSLNSTSVKDIDQFINDIYNEHLPALGISQKISDHVKLDKDKFTIYAKSAAEDKLNRFFPEPYTSSDFMKILNNSC